MSIDTVIINRTETIIYSRAFDRAELLNVGFTADDLESPTDLQDALNSGTRVLELSSAKVYVEEETDRHGDVQGQEYEVVSA